MKKNIFFSIVLISSLMVYGFAGKKVSNVRNDHTYRLHASVIPFSPEILNVIAGEFKGMLANYLLLEAATFIGSKQKGTDEDWKAVSLLLDQSSVLDPYFKHTYRLAQSTLPWEAENVEQAIVILERSRENLTWDWVPGYFIGFDYFYFKKDNLTASEKLMETSHVPGAPAALVTWASRLASRVGRTETAIEFLNSVIDSTDDGENKKLLQKRVKALEGVLVIEHAVKLYNAKFEKAPESIEDLVKHSVITDLPENPYGRPYILIDGFVEF